MARGTATLEVRNNDMSNDQGRAACDEHSSLRRVPDRIPWVVLLILIVELGERFTYFGLSAPIQNYIKCVETLAYMVSRILTCTGIHTIPDLTFQEL
jgi:hypothetical protein